MSRLKAFSIVAAAGMVCGFSFPPSFTGTLALVAFVPLIVVMERHINAPHRQSLLYTYFFCFHGAANWWVLSWQQETDPYLMAAGAGLWLAHPFFLMPAFWIYLYVRKRTSLATSLAILTASWTAAEWLHSLSDASYPWLALGYTQTYYTTLIQIADVAGVWSVGMYVMAVNCILAHLALRRSSPGRHVLLVVVVTAIIVSYGFMRVQQADRDYAAGGASRITAGLVQPSINPWQKWQGGIGTMIAEHRRLQDSLNTIIHCDVSVWSETAIPIGLRLPDNEHILQSVREWVDSSETSLLTGYADYELYNHIGAPDNTQNFPHRPQLKMKVFNAAGLISAHHSAVPTHHKSHLTPFGEYMPFSDDVPQIQSWLQWGVGISGWNKGAGATVLPLLRANDTIARIGPVICIESIYPDYVADYVRRGANVLAVITNDAWYDGTFGPEQHYCISRMRAVETRREVMRCGNSGVSGFIDKVGRSTHQALERVPLALHGTVRLWSEQSMYVRYGDWLPKVLTIVVVVSVIWIAFHSRRSADTRTPGMVS